MKTKEEILKMSKEELQKYKWNDDLNQIDSNSRCYECTDCSRCSNCTDCSRCLYCTDCYDCYECSRCLYCRNLRSKTESFYICNIEVTEEEYNQKLKELGVNYQNE